MRRGFSPLIVLLLVIAALAARVGCATYYIPWHLDGWPYRAILVTGNMTGDVWLLVDMSNWTEAFANIESIRVMTPGGQFITFYVAEYRPHEKLVIAIYLPQPPPEYVVIYWGNPSVSIPGYVWAPDGRTTFGGVVFTRFSTVGTAKYVADLSAFTTWQGMNLTARNTYGKLIERKVVLDQGASTAYFYYTNATGPLVLAWGTVSSAHFPVHEEPHVVVDTKAQDADLVFKTYSGVHGGWSDETTFYVSVLATSGQSDLNDTVLAYIRIMEIQYPARFEGVMWLSYTTGPENEHARFMIMDGLTPVFYVDYYTLSNTITVYFMDQVLYSGSDVVNDFNKIYVSVYMSGLGENQHAIIRVWSDNGWSWGANATYDYEGRLDYVGYTVYDILDDPVKLESDYLKAWEMSEPSLYTTITVDDFTRYEGPVTIEVSSSSTEGAYSVEIVVTPPPASIGDAPAPVGGDTLADFIDSLPEGLKSFAVYAIPLLPLTLFPVGYAGFALSASLALAWALYLAGLAPWSVSLLQTVVVLVILAYVIEQRKGV